MRAPATPAWQRFDAAAPLRRADRPDVAVAAALQRLDPALAPHLLTEGPPQRGDLDGQIAFLHHDAGPCRLDQRVLGDGRSRALDEHPQQGDGALAQRDRLGAAKQDLSLPIEAEWTQLIARRHRPITPGSETFWNYFAGVSRLSILPRSCWHHFLRPSR